MIRATTAALYSLYGFWLLLFLVLWGNFSCEYPAFFDDGAFYSMAYAHNAGLNFYDGMVDVKPPLLIYLASLGFRLSSSICFIKWCGVAVFGALILSIYLTLVFVSGRSDIACFGVTLVATNWAIRHYGFVELSQSYWQALLCWFSLIAVLAAINIRKELFRFETFDRLLPWALIFLGSFIWAIALYTKQQSIVLFPAVVAVTLVYSWSYETLTRRFCYLSMFAIGAVAFVCLLYEPVLGNSPIADSYKYIFQSNMARNANRAINDYGWLLAKSSALMAILSQSAKVPIIAFIGFEAYRLVGKMFRIGRFTEGVTSLNLENLGRHTDDLTAKGRGAALIVAMTVWALSSVVFYFLHNLTQAHYLLEVAVAVAIVIPLIVCAGGRYSQVGIMSINVLIMSAICVWHGIATDPLGAAMRDKWKADRDVAAVISKCTDKQDKILLFSNPVLYYLADRLPASRFPFFADAWSTPFMMSEYRRAILSSITTGSAKAIIMHDRSIRQMPEWLRTLIIDELRSSYRALAFEREDVMFGTTQIYVRNPQIPLHSSSTSENGNPFSYSHSPLIWSACR
jgi:hypothetical protein